MGQTGEEGQVINLDLPNVNFLPYMVYITLKGHKIVSNPWKFPSTLPAKVGGEGITFLWFGILLESILSEYFHRGLNGSICPVFGIKCKEVM